MFGNGHFDQVRDLFADQFTPDGSSFVYRKSMKGEAKQVSASEREAFLETFKSRLRYLSWSIVPATSLLIVTLVFFGFDTESRSADVAVYAGISCILIVFLGGYYWAWNAPERALGRRPSVRLALSRQEARKVAFSKITYGQLALCAPLSSLLLLKVLDDHDVLHGWGMLWAVGATGLVVLAGIQAFRKWRLERQDSVDSQNPM